MMMTNTVKVVFSGRILPAYVLIEGMRVVFVRSSTNQCSVTTVSISTTRKNTAKRRQSVPTAKAKHQTKNCDNNQADRQLCPYCFTKHDDGRPNCPHFAEVTECYRQKQERETRYVNSVAALTQAPTAAAP